jgi:hypothetical protein
MIDQILATFPIATLQVPYLKTFQQDFRLIQPGRMSGRRDNLQPIVIAGAQK